MTSLKDRSAASIERSGRRLEVIDDDHLLVRDADFVLSMCLRCRNRCLMWLSQPFLLTGAKPIFVECERNSAPANHAPYRGDPSRGPLHRCGHHRRPSRSRLAGSGKGPRFYASGGPANELLRLGKFGLDITILDAPVGAASALKLAYAGMTKGFTGSRPRCSMRPRREGLADALQAELSRTQPGFLARLERSIPDMFPKAYRWVAEMEQIAEFIGDAREGATIYAGASLLYEWIASELNSGTATASRRSRSSAKGQELKAAGLMNRGAESRKTMQALNRAAESNGKGLDKATLDSALDRLIETNGRREPRTRRAAGQG